MANFWCVEPATDRLELTIQGRDAWLVVARELSVGEQRKVDTAGFKGMTTPQPAGPGQDQREAEITIDWRGTTFARTLAYVKDWSLKDDRDNKLPITLDQLLQFRKPVYAAIEEAINRHVESREKEKNAPAPAGTPELVETSS